MLVEQWNKETLEHKNYIISHISSLLQSLCSNDFVRSILFIPFLFEHFERELLLNLERSGFCSLLLCNMLNVLQNFPRNKMKDNFEIHLCLTSIFFSCFCWLSHGDITLFI
jgi:hypothetical protein